VDWLTTLTVEREVANGTGGGAGKAKIVLCGHRSVHFAPSKICSLAVLYFEVWVVYSRPMRFLRLPIPNQIKKLLSGPEL
jgi:hypothetical protein